MSQKQKLEAFPTVRLANAVHRMSPAPGPSRNTIGLESITPSAGELTNDPWLDSDNPGNLYLPGEILYGKLRPYLAKVWIADRSGNYIGDFIRMRPANIFTAQYLRYALLTNQFTQQASNAATGTKMPRTEWGSLKYLRIPSPSRETQTVIVDYLDHETAEMDALVADTRDLMDAVALRRRSLIDHVFMDSGWPEVALKYRGELRSGLTLGKTPDSDTHSYPYLRVANVQVGRVDLYEVVTIDLPITQAERYRLHEGDVLMTEGGDRDKLGRGAIWGAEIDPMLHQNHVFAFRCGSLLSPEFLVYGLEATPARVYFDQTARQSTNLASTNSTVVKNFRLPMPPLEEQHRVVASLNHELTYMFDMVANAKKIAILARERRAALITAAVTGQIDVTARNKPAAEQLEDDIAQGLHREN